MNIELVLDYVTIDNDLFFDINSGNKKVAEMSISNDIDSYVIMLKAYTDFHLKYQKCMDDAINELFEKIYDFIEQYNLVDQYNKPVLLLEDEDIASRYAINNDLRRVPRYCGFYLYN